MAQLEAELALERQKAGLLDQKEQEMAAGGKPDMADLDAMFGGALPPEGGEAPADPMVDDQAMPMDQAMPAAPPPTVTDDQVLEQADVKDVERATGRMVEAGLIERAGGTITPDVEAILVATVDTNFPGMLDLRDPADLNELLKGVANGTIEPVGPAGKLG